MKYTVKGGLKFLSRLSTYCLLV